MAKKTKPAAPKAPKGPTLVTSNDAPVESSKPAPALAAVAGGEPPKDDSTPLCRKVKAKMDSIREATTTELHTLAVECMAHGEKTGDLRPLLTFQNELPKSLRKVAFMAWCKAFGPIKWGKRDKLDNAEGIKKDQAADAKPWDIEGCTKVTFYDVQEKEEKPVAFLDVLKKIQADIKKIDECLADPTIKRKDNETDEQLRALKAKHGKVIAALMAA